MKNTSQKPTLKSIPIGSIVVDGDTQVRVQSNKEVIQEYAEAFQDRESLPPVVVFEIDGKFLLADGFHRFHAAKLRGLSDLQASVHHGSRLDALKYALGANSKHGLRRTNEDKRNAVTIALRQFKGLSDRQIAKICCVSVNLVGQVRHSSDEFTTDRRTGADGKEYRNKRKSAAPLARGIAPSRTLEPNPAIPRTGLVSGTEQSAPAANSDPIEDYLLQIEQCAKEAAEKFPGHLEDLVRGLQRIAEKVAARSANTSQTLQNLNGTQSSAVPTTTN